HFAGGPEGRSFQGPNLSAPAGQVRPNGPLKIAVIGWRQLQTAGQPKHPEPDFSSIAKVQGPIPGNIGGKALKAGRVRDRLGSVPSLGNSKEDRKGDHRQQGRGRQAADAAEGWVPFAPAPNLFAPTDRPRVQKRLA